MPDPIDAKTAAEIDQAWAEYRAAKAANSPSHQAYQRDSQRLTELDLAFNGLLDKQTFADPRHEVTAEGLRSTQDTVSMLLDQARGRDFTAREASEWQAALSDQASYYATEEGRAR